MRLSREQFCLRVHELDPDASGSELAQIIKDHEATQRAELAQYKDAIEVIQSSRDICLNTFTAWAMDAYGPAKHALRKLPEVEQRNAALVEALENLLITHYRTMSEGPFRQVWEEAQQALAREKETADG